MASQIRDDGPLLRTNKLVGYSILGNRSRAMLVSERSLIVCLERQDESTIIWYACLSTYNPILDAHSFETRLVVEAVSNMNSARSIW